MQQAKETLDNDAYLLSCKCPTCGHRLSRGYEEDTFYCRYCGEHLHARAFTDSEVKDAHFISAMDTYEEN